MLRDVAISFGLERAEDCRKEFHLLMEEVSWSIAAEKYVLVHFFAHKFIMPVVVSY